ncbi:ATP-binding protein [Flexivirga endophytica]|uniref:ATP-binding protein n=1 Tax=Flexivirga endophytica TaxID=1849103 RepID=A0A916SVY4_9MICO|nr:ATP/GTP-binding protein [Flexivirga endophytica]GGB18801.1 ATP-binding protein [Flexivirga endophytica]GHB36869.1 ATP-binding protein [Flexivirga endophytica]
MAKYPRVREQHVAVFGEAGSGKTVLLSSFFGPTQSGTYQNDLWDLVADDAGQGTRLYKNYLGMRDRALTPMTTRFNNTTFYFSVKLKSGDAGAAKKRPFDALRLAWHDYPGEWFENEPSSAAERDRRTDTFRSLLRSDVAVLLVDGQKLLDNSGEEERYLKSLIGNFRQSLLRLKDDLLAEEGRIVEFPRIWVLALSKADLLPDWDINTFRDLVILNAADDIDRLRSTIGDLIETPDALSIGEDFMLLSSAKFELKSDGLEPVTIDLSRRVGVDLVLPLASLLPLERRVQWHDKMAIPTRVLDSLADGAELLAAGLAGGKFAPIEKLLGRMAKGNVGAAIAGKGLPILVEAVKLAGPKLKELNEQARAQHDYLRATLTQFKLDLEQAEADKVLRTSK